MSRISRYRDIFGEGDEGIMVCQACLCSGGYEVIDTSDNASTGKCQACGVFGPLIFAKKKV